MDDTAVHWMTMQLMGVTTRITMVIACMLFACAAEAAASLAGDGIGMSLQFPEAEAYGTIHVRTKIGSSPEAVWQVMSDVNRWQHWMPLVRKAYFFSPTAARHIHVPTAKDHERFEQLHVMHPGTASPPSLSGRSDRTSYEYYDLPWPIKNEWVVQQYHYNASQAKMHRYRATWKKVWGDGGEEGYWTLEPFHGDPSATLFTYHFRVKAKKGLGLALFKMGVKRTIKRMVWGIRHEAPGREIVPTT